MEEIARLNVFSDRLQARNESKNETSTIYRNKGLCLYVRTLQSSTEIFSRI